VHYANLKKIIYDIARLEQAQREHAFHGDGEHGLSEPLLRGSGRIAGDVKVLSAQVIHLQPSGQALAYCCGWAL
jgi:hypothetical protein